MTDALNLHAVLVVTLGSLLFFVGLVLGALFSRGE